MMKRLIALVLAMVLCLGLFAGCADKEEVSELAELDFEKAFAKHDADTVVMTINGQDVTWSEYYYMLSSAVNQLTYYMGGSSWDEKVLEGYDATIDSYSMQLALDSIKQFHVTSTKAEESGITLTDEDKANIAATEENFKKQNLGENVTDEDFNKFLMENFYLTRDVYDFINTNSVLYEKLFEEYIGKKGEKLTDEDINDFITNMPYVTCKHILIKTIDASGAALPQEDIDAAETKAKELYNQLVKIKDQKKLVKTFDEFIDSYSMDEGQELFVDGYTFTKDEMYPVFEDAAFALEEYQISEIVRSDAGFHILLRLPTTRESTVDFDYQNNQMYTIATYAATHKYSLLIADWMDEADVVWKEEFKDLTAKEIFA